MLAFFLQKNASPSLKKESAVTKKPLPRRWTLFSCAAWPPAASPSTPPAASASVPAPSTLTTTDHLVGAWPESVRFEATTTSARAHSDGSNHLPVFTNHVSSPNRVHRCFLTPLPLFLRCSTMVSSNAPRRVAVSKDLLTLV